MEKFKEGYTGKNFTVEAPKLEFKKPVFKKSIDLPKASTNQVAKEYLEKTFFLLFFLYTYIESLFYII